MLNPLRPSRRPSKSAKVARRAALVATLLAGLSLSSLYADPASSIQFTGNAITPVLSITSGVLDGNSSTGYFVGSGGTLSASNVTFMNFGTTGGSGSGGGGGLGGAIFVGAGGNVTLSNVNFYANTATGGTGGLGKTGGSLNGLFQSNNVGSLLNGANGANAFSGSATVNDGNAASGFNGQHGGSNLTITGVTGGNGGAGGNGGNGVTVTAQTIYEEATLAFDSAVAAAELTKAAAEEADSIAKAAEAAGDEAEAASFTALAAEEELLADTETAEGVAEDAAALDPFESGAAIAASVGAYAQAIEEQAKVVTEGTEAAEEAEKGVAAGTESAAEETKSITDGDIAAAEAVKIAADTAYLLALETTREALGVTGLGGNGGVGAAGGPGSYGAGGGAGGAGGLGGDAAEDTTALGGTGGNGGLGGLGGFGAGGGQGGDAGLGGETGLIGGVNGADGAAGAGGTGGFGAGIGATGVDADGNTYGGQGGSGFGGAIFVQKGGFLTITGDAIFTGNNSVAGDSANALGGTTGQAAGTDIFMMSGSHVVLDPGAGHLQIFNGTIADDSSESIAGTGITPGKGAGITIASGQVDFNGANTYSGTTLITGGVLQAQDGIGLPTGSNLDFQGGVLQSSGSFVRFLGTATGRVQWTGDGGFAAIGGGLTVTLNAGLGLTWGSGNFVGAGHSLLFGSATATDNVTFTNAINLNGNNGNILVAANADNSDNAIMTGVISNGSISVGDVNHTGILYFTAANTYNGGTTINAGTLALSGQGSLSATGAVQVNTLGTFDISKAGNQTIGDLGGHGTVNLGSRSLTLGTANNVLFSGTINDGGLGGGTGGSVIKQGSGLWVLTGANTYAGGTIIKGGTLAIGAGGSLYSSGDVTIQNNSAFDISTGGNQTIGNLIGNGTVYLGANEITLGGSQDALYSGVIVGSGGVTKQGAGVWTLTGANGYTGGTIIDAGTIALGVNGSLSAIGDIVVNAQGTFDISQSANQTIGNVSGTGKVLLGSRWLYVGSANDSLFAGSLEDGGLAGGTGASLFKQGAGTFTLTGANTYTGWTNVHEGTLALAGNGTLSHDSSLYVGSTFDISQGINQQVGDFAGTGTINLGSQKLSAGGTPDEEFSGTINDGGIAGGTGGQFEKIGSGTLYFTGANTYSGGTTVTGGTLALAGNGVLNATGSVAVNSVFDISISNHNQTIGDLSGTGTVNLGQVGLIAGTAGNSSFTGTINDGGLMAGTGGFLMKQNAGTLSLGGANTYTGGTYIQGGTLALTGAGSLYASGLVWVHGTFDISQASASQTIGTLQGDGTIDLGNNRLTMSSSTDSVFTGVIENSAPVSLSPSLHHAGLVLNLPSGGSLVKDGTSTLTLTGVNTYTGGTTVAGGTLALAGGGQLAPTGAVAVQGTFDISQSGNQTIGDLSGSGAVKLGSFRLVTGSASDSLFSGSLQDGGLGGGTGGSLFKEGSGTLTLTGVNTYTGGTIISQGTLVVSGNGQLSTTGTIVNNGTLDLTNALNQQVGNVTGNGVVKLGTAQLSLGTDQDFSFDGSLTGSGSLNKQGSGTLTVTGNSTNTGGTTISAGVLQVGNGGTSGSLGSGPIVDNSILAFDRSDTLTVTSAISGTGILAQIGTGTTILTGVNSYTGGTMIAGGTLQIGNGGTAGNLASGPVLDNGNLVINLSSNTTLSAAIGGSGNLSVIGKGITTLTGNNSYSGTTTISQGTLLVGNGGTSGSLGAGQVLNNGTLEFNRADNVTVSNLITGSGNLLQIGRGTVRLGTEKYTGYTNVSAGQLIVDGALSSGQVNVGTGGAFAGTTYVAGNFYNAGSLSPGDVVGHMAVNGTFIQAATGNFLEQLASSTAYDSLHVNQNVNLAGKLTVQAMNGYIPVLGQDFVIIDSTKGIAGRFANVASANAMGLKVRYEAKSVDLLETKNLFETAATTKPTATKSAATVAASPAIASASGKTAALPANLGAFKTQQAATPALEQTKAKSNPSSLTASELSVAHALDSMVLKSGHTERDSVVLAWLDHDLTSNLRHDFDLLSPEALTALFQADYASSIALSGNLEAQLDRIHADAPMRGASIAGTYDGRTILTSADTSGSRLGLWVTGDAEFTNVDNSANALGYDVITSGVTAGVDYKFCSHFVAGLYFDYVNTDADLPNGGSLRANGGKGGVYASLFGDGFYLNGSIGGGASSFRSARAGLGGTAFGDSSYNDFETHLSAGYDAHAGNFTLSPYASFDYDQANLSGFRERGSLAPLNILSHSESDTRTDIGVRITYTKQIGSATIRPTVHAAWEHDYSGRRDTIYARLNGSSQTIGADAPVLGTDGAVLGGGVSVDFKRVSLYLSDEVRVGRSNYSSNTVTGGLRWSW